MKGQGGTIDYLVIGHVTLDLTPDGATAGGTVTYAARTAQALGYRAAVLTSCGPTFVAQEHLPGVAMQVEAAAATTTFTNTDTPTGRQQTLHQRAAPLTPAALPPDWAAARVVHLGPIADEVDPAWIDRFAHSVIGMTPQGWLRRWDETGRVQPRPWPEAAAVLPRADVVILSEEDLLDAAMLDQFRQLSRLLVLTRAAAGCTVFYDDQTRDVPGVPVDAVESTGAGDIFAAAFLTFWQQHTGDPAAAAAFANQVAAASVTQATPAAKFARIKQLNMIQRPKSLNL